MCDTFRFPGVLDEEKRNGPGVLDKEKRNAPGVFDEENGMP